jgi:hypothetical protein
VKKQKRRGEGPRKAQTYRAARRNAALRGEVPGVWKSEAEIKRRPTYVSRRTHVKRFPGRPVPIRNGVPCYPYDGEHQRKRYARQHAAALAKSERQPFMEAAE